MGVGKERTKNLYNISQLFSYINQEKVSICDWEWTLPNHFDLLAKIPFYCLLKRLPRRLLPNLIISLSRGQILSTNTRSFASQLNPKH